MKKKANVLEALVHPLSAEEFLSEYWIKRSFIGHGPLSRFPGLSTCKDLKDIGSVLDLVQKIGQPDVKVRAWFQDTYGYHRMATLPAQECKSLYQSGTVTAVIDFINSCLPFLDRMMVELQTLLETSMPKGQGNISVNVYGSPVGKGSVMHFDHQEVFLIQLRGKKQWKISPNTQIKYPSEPHFGGKIGVNNLLVCSEFPKVMPDDHETVVLKPGSVMFLPRGTWHTSYTLEESLALTLTFPSIIWADLVLNSLRTRLIAKELWRHPGVGVPSKGKAHGEAKRMLATLLQDLKVEVDKMIG